MKSSIFYAAAAAGALLSAGAFAQNPKTDPSAPSAQPSEPAQESQRGATFESLDVNSDGKISKAEAAASSTVSAQFASYDKNGDGFIEKAEVNSSNGAEPETPKQ